MSINKLVQYRFRFVYPTVDEVIYPKYDDKLILTTEKESDEYFYRTKTSYEFILTREDYQLIKDAPFDEDYEIILESSYDGGAWTEKWKGTFNYTDCKFDDDKMNVRFSADTNDSYEPILNNWEREFNLFDLDIGFKDVTYIQPGLVQFYVLGTDVVTNYTANGSYFDQKMNNPTQDASTLSSVNLFSLLGGLKYWVSGSGDISPDVSGEYTYNGVTFKYENGLYEIDFVASSRIFVINDSDIHDFDDFDSVWSVGGVNFVFKGRIDIDGEKNLYFFRQGGSNSAPATGTLTHVSGATNTTDIIYTSTEEFDEDDGIRRTIQLISGEVKKFIGPTFKGSAFEFSNAYGYIFESLDNSDKCSLHIAGVLVRVLTNQSVLIGGQTVTELPTDDIVRTNYKYAIDDIDPFDDFYFSDEHSAISGFFGKYAADAPNYESEYFVRPTSPTDLIPLAQSTWKYGSLWFKMTVELNGLSVLGRTTKTIQAFKLSDVITSLLGEFSTVTYLPDTDHSTFLYSTNNPISGDVQNEIYITPKSNITKNGYDFAASRALVKFKDLIDGIKTMLHCGWHIDSSDRFRIEHALWYWYGGQNTSPLISTDLTTLTHPMTQKLWTFGTNKYDFEKSSIPSQSTFKWMDVSSDVFEGFPIEYTDKYVKKSSIDTNVVSIFSSDADAMTSNPDNFSKEGFAILDINEFNAINYEWITFKGITMAIQNGRFSFPYLHDSYFKNPSKCGSININGADFTSTQIGRTKNQEIEFPMSLPTFDPIGLVKTQIGDGKIGSMTENILSHEIKAKLRHDTKK